MALDASQQAAYDSLLASSGQERADSYRASMQPAAQPTSLYQGLTATSTPEQIAAAYSQFTSGAGGDTETNRDAAVKYLESLGVGTPAIGQAYNQYLQPAAVAAPVTTPSTPQSYDQAYVNQLVREAATQAGGTLSYADTLNAAKNLNIPESMVNSALSTGVITDAPVTSYEQMVRDAYGSIGRTGIGEGASNIDQSGFDNWVNALKTGAVNPADLPSTFKGAVADYLIANPEDKYSTYVTDYLQGSNNQEISGIKQLYQDVLGRDADAGGLGNWYKQFGSEISPDERAQFEKSAQTELDTRVKSLYTDFLGRDADAGGVEFWRGQFGSSIDDADKEKFRQSAATEIKKQFGVTAPGAAPTTEGILAGFKYANENDLDEDALRKTLGDDVFNTYKAGLANFAKNNLSGFVADNSITFDEAKAIRGFSKDTGYNSQEMADLTGLDKSFFDDRFRQYDDTANTIIDSVMDSKDFNTPGKKIAGALALEDKYGFTDEDFSKATGVPIAEVKSLLDPARGFSKTYQDTLSKPDVTGKEILSLLEKSKADQGIGTVYGPTIDAQIAKINELNDKWKGYKVDGYQAENIYNQITQINKAVGGGNWSGSWMGGGDNAAKEATALLMKRGVDNLSDLKVEKNYEKTPANIEFYNGQRVFTAENGRKYTVKAVSYGGDDVQNTAELLPPDAKTTPGYLQETYSGGDSYSYIPQQLTADELKTFDPKTGRFDKDIGNKLIDKSTGKVVGASTDNNFLLDYYDTGNFFKGKDKYLGITVNDQGVPVPYQTTEKSGLAYSPVLPIMLSMLAPGVSNMLSASLPGAGVAAGGMAELGFTAAVAPTLTNQLLTGAIMGGGQALLTDQDPLKGALFGAIGPAATAGVSSVLPAGMDPALAKAITNAGTAIAKGVLQGQDFGDLLGQAVVGGATSYGLGQIGKEFGLTPAQTNLAASVAVPLIQGKDVDPGKVVNALVQAVPKTPVNNAPVVDMGPTSQGTNITKELSDAGLEEDDEVGLPSGIQTASTDGGLPVRAEVSGTPIFAEDPRSKSIRPPAGYTLVSNKDPSSDEPARYDDNDRLLPKSDGSYYDITQNAWFKPSGEFDLSNVTDYSGLFDDEKINLTDADLAAISGSDAGSGSATDLTYDDLLNLTGGSTTSKGSSGAAGVSTGDAGTIEIVGERPSAGNAGTIEVVGERPAVNDAGTIEVVDKRPIVDDAGTIEIVGERPVLDDAGTIEIVGERPVLDEVVTPPAVVTPPTVVTPPVTPPVVTPPVVVPPVKPPVVTPPVKVTPKQVASMLGVSVSNPIVQDVMEALYGTMEYLDIGEEFEPSKRKAKPAATTKQLQQTKMAQGGYLDDLLAENMSVDDLLNLLR